MNASVSRYGGVFIEHTDLCVNNCLCSLKKLSGKTLISDISSIRTVCTKLPKVLFHYLLTLACEENRLLAMAHLLKYYPEETLTIKENYFAVRSNQSALDERGYALMDTKPFAHVYQTILAVFKNTVRGEYPHSNLLKLDYKEVPCNFQFLNSMWKDLSEEIIGRRPCEYILKLNVIIPEQGSLLQFCSSMTGLKNRRYPLKFEIGALHFNCCYFSECEPYLLNSLNLQELEYLSLHFCVIRSLDIILTMQKCHNLKAIDLSYSDLNFTNNPPLLDTFSKALHELVHISHLNLMNCKISGCLRALFQQYCTKETHHSSKIRKTEEELCCPSHHAKLQYLNLSGCYPTSEDLKFLTTSPISKKLVFLDLSYYKVDVNCLTELLTVMLPTVELLNLSCMTYDGINLDPLFAVLLSLPKIRFLNILDLHVQHGIDEDNLIRKALELRKKTTFEKLAISYISSRRREKIFEGTFRAIGYCSCRKRNENALDYLINHL